MQKEAVSIHWFRRDLRLEDNNSLFKAASCDEKLLLLFVFDTEILDRLEEGSDSRITFIHSTLSDINTEIRAMGGELAIYHGTALEAFTKLIEQYNIVNVFANEDYEPYGIIRDLGIEAFLQKQHIPFTLLQDHVIMHPNKVLTDAQKPYSVFTPYMKKWFSLFNTSLIQEFKLPKLINRIVKNHGMEMPRLSDIGFGPSKIRVQNAKLSDALLLNYAENRDFPAMDGTSRIGPHLRFGLISIRKAMKIAFHGSKVWMQELIWREFFIQVLFHFPRTKDYAFRPAYDRISWINDPTHFERWCAGETGYPLVDAGMRQLQQTGFMHNRVRMVAASFLTKHLLIDWRWGEAWFAKLLLDYEMSSNVGNWQWAAGSGCDAAPYFRIFNPLTQQKKFDKDQQYINEWIPDQEDYKRIIPIVEHSLARKRCLETYTKALAP